MRSAPSERELSRAARHTRCRTRTTAPEAATSSRTAGRMADGSCRWVRWGVLLLAVVVVLLLSGRCQCGTWGTALDDRRAGKERPVV